MGIICVLLVLFLMTCSACRILGCSGDFSETCSNVQLVGTSSLQALCGDGQGGFQTSLLNLDEHIANSNGSLECNTGGGNFSASCEGWSLVSSNSLAADCSDDYGDFFQTSIDLDDCVQNASGALGWTCV